MPLPRLPRIALPNGMPKLWWPPEWWRRAALVALYVLLPVMALLLAACAFVYRHLLPTFESYFDTRREKLLEALG